MYNTKGNRGFGGTSESSFIQEVERRKSEIAAAVRRSDILYSQEADRSEYWNFYPFIVRQLRTRAAHYLDAAERAQAGA